ncbi:MULTISPECIES: hypothetical protein [unclassified Pseudomonas]|uniref:hypothetical protein n=1 Tax=unclassified Pseudomonas TaxID=196821 RepID=UPI0015A1F4D7|nr:MULTISPECIES: hypothetical protein [unclassified Pseudomonas]NWB62047.1 hypothetical protein [Pseudomonas sp. F1002]NWC01476.1 hypothetical protein [Pseudomonas sp. G1002]
MIEQLPNVPPALLMLIAELAKSSSELDARKRIRGMLRELRDQSEVFIEENLTRDGRAKDPFSFDVHLHGALDVLSGSGCYEMSCRMKAADQIARSVGLFADKVWITDHISDAFLDFGRATNEKIEMIVRDVSVLSRLLPLILSGVVRFRSPWAPTCSNCFSEFEGKIATTAQELAGEFLEDFVIEHSADDEYFINTGSCFDPPLVFRGLFPDAPNAKEIAEGAIYSELRSAFFIAREAACSGGSVFSNSRIGMAGLMRSEGRTFDKRTLLAVDKERELQIPWVSELDAAQIVQLRLEASDALPAFREKMARMLSCQGGANSYGGGQDQVIADLREQAIDVRNELKISQSNSGKYWKTAFGILGLGVSAYGAANDSVAAGIGGLLPIIQLMIDHKKDHGSDVSRLISQPGYVLVRAQDILSHAH